MGCRRRLGLVVASTVVVAAAATPASAQTIGLPGIGDLVTLDDGCVDVDDLTLGELASLGADVCVSDDGVAIDVDAYLAEQQVPTDPVTGAVGEAATTVTEPVRRAAGGSGGSGGDGGGSGSPAPAPSDPPPADAEPDLGSPEGSAAPRTPTEPGSGGVVDRSSGAEQRERARQLAAVRALRADLARGVDLDTGVAGPVVPLGGPITTGDLAAPQVAEGTIVPGVDGRLAPDAVGDQDALLASSAPTRVGGEVPLALQLLAAALVLASGAVWTIARRELGGALPEEL